ncbi:FKBP-like protein [Phanerochaete sordida]|uniref:FK506-binding protein n=1 Tax=Phanerochaete sordida TaxID=48140 RepID=A0A9P3G3Z2_9APHY|nr:FKBP-like protein [Phanerochaete sordida]
MVVAVALWSLELKPGQQEALMLPSDLRITNVALGDELEDESARTSVKLTYRGPSGGDDSDEESQDEEEEDDDVESVTTVLCSLTPGKIEQTTVDLILEAEEEILLENTGKNTVYLTGNYIDQIPGDPYGSDNEDEFDSDEEAYRLEDVSSDVEFDADELDDEEDDSHRFEEITDETTTTTTTTVKADSKKRPRDSDVVETDEPKLSKAQQKKLNKKLKAEDGKAVPTGTEKKEAEKPKAEDKKKEKKEQPKKEEKKEAEKKKAAEVKTLDGGLKIQDHKVGSGPAARPGNLVKVRYVGKLQNGKIFDSNTKGDPFKFKLGKGEVIKGWDMGIAGMQVGGERLLTIPAALAYGKRAQGGIPANSTLIFEVKLLGIN